MCMTSWYLPVWKKGLGTRQIQKDACVVENPAKRKGLHEGASITWKKKKIDTQSRYEICGFGLEAKKKN